MGRPRKQPADEFVEDPPTEQEIQNEQQYQDYLNTLGDSGVTVTIHRFPKVGKDMEWADDTTIDQAPLSILRDKYGPGKYRLTFKWPNGTYAGMRTVAIAAPYIANGHNGNGTDDFQKTLMLTLIANLKPAPALDIGAMLAGMGAMMTALKPAEAPKGVDPLAMFQSILTMYQSLKPKEEKSELDRLRDTAAVIKEFSSDSKGIDGPWDVVASVGKDVVEKLAPVLTGAVTGTRAPAQTPTGAPVERPAIGAPVAAVGPATENPSGATPAASDPQQNLRNWIQSQIAFFKPKAIAGKDPGFWIDYVFENQEEPGCQALLYAIRQGATFENLLAFDPEIGQNPSLTFWFREVFDGIQSGLQGNVDSARESVNQGDNSGDGTFSPAGQSMPGNTGSKPAVS